MLDFNGKRFQTRNLGAFDVQGQRPEWYHVGTSPWEAYDFCKRQGTVIWNDMTRPPQRLAQRQQCSQGWEVLAASDQQGDILEQCSDALAEIPGNEAVDTIRAMTLDTVASKAIKHWEGGEIWTQGFKAGFEFGRSVQINQDEKSSITCTK